MKVFGQLEKAQLENTTSDTASHPKGMITYRTDLNQAKVSNGTTYKLLIDEDSTQTLSNKTYANPSITGAITAAQTTTPANPASGSNKLYFKADGKLYTLDSAGNEAMVGSGTGGVKNLITNGNADDTSSSIFVPYADAASTRPVDGTGGSPTVTTSMTTSTPLDGAKSFLLTKPASNVQGQGWSVPFTVDPAYRAKSLKISVDYIVNSGTFVAGGSSTESDIIWYIYDVTNSQLIEPSNIKMFSNNSSIADKFEATFQSSATGSSYRLIAHVQSVSALAYELKVDNITVSPQTYVFGTPVTDLKSETLSVNGTPTLASTYHYWSRVGDRIKGYGGFQITALVTTDAGINLPSGVSIDTVKIGTSRKHVFGEVTRTVASGTAQANQKYVLIYNTTYPNKLMLSRESQSQNQQQIGWDSLFAVNDWVYFEYEVPVTGWSSSVQMSDSADTRVVAAAISSSSSTSVANSANTKVAFQSVSVDTHGGWDLINNRYVVKVAGKYSVSSLLVTAASTAFGANSLFSALLYKNGVQALQLGWVIGNGTYQFGVSGSGIVDAKSGDYFEIFCFQNSGASINLLNSLSHVDIQMIQGPSAIASHELISASYWLSANQTTSAQINFDSKEYDSHGAVTTGVGAWKFTAPAAGLYTFSFKVYGGATAFNVQAYKNGSLYRVNTDSSTNFVAGGTFDVRLNAGEYMDIRPSSSATITGNASLASSSASWIQIKRIGL